MEYYELYKLDETIPLKKQNLFAPKHLFRLLVASTSESGKTSMVVHLLLGSKYLKIYLWMSGKKCSHKVPKGKSKNFGERYIPYDNLIVVVQHQDEELWEAVQYFYEFIVIDKQAPYQFTVIVFDNLASEPLATQLKVVPFFRSRVQQYLNPTATSLTPEAIEKIRDAHAKQISNRKCIMCANYKIKITSMNSSISILQPEILSIHSLSSARNPEQVIFLSKLATKKTSRKKKVSQNEELLSSNIDKTNSGVELSK
ncbi:3794_t:CDS:2, partial [Scutellospora calospora]